MEYIYYLGCLMVGGTIVVYAPFMLYSIRQVEKKLDTANTYLKHIKDELIYMNTHR